ncbi:hypothetical protein [Hymenobacter sp. HDW8]|uniref:hypothetical protein n=1 Tax=Hymenobacter sp. HDW8 TaxID=2714932 RepID=UPI0014088BFD|nr:hypothetical protein [Hymenobacter sp. HDW8]QIL74994.1 hypothetical protein G7064_03335 [Hymenobacter sp. HDW8]
MENQEQSRFEYDEWIEQVRPDLRSTDQLTLLQGFIGRSSENGHLRVYSDESLNNFVEVPEDAIVHAVKLSEADSPLGGSKLWLRSDVVVTYGDPKAANRPRTTFLEGDLMQQYATQYGGGYDAMGGGYDAMGGAGAFGGQFEPAGGGQGGGQFMATVPAIQCVQPVRTVIGPNCPGPVLQTSVRTICRPLTCLRTACGPVTCLRTACGPQTCLRTLCGPQTCHPIICGGIPCQFTSRPPLQLPLRAPQVLSLGQQGQLGGALSLSQAAALWVGKATLTWAATTGLSIPI